MKKNKDSAWWSIARGPWSGLAWHKLQIAIYNQQSSPSVSTAIAKYIKNHKSNRMQYIFLKCHHVLILFCFAFLRKSTKQKDNLPFWMYLCLYDKTSTHFFLKAFYKNLKTCFKFALLHGFEFFTKPKTMLHLRPCGIWKEGTFIFFFLRRWKTKLE